MSTDESPTPNQKALQAIKDKVSERKLILLCIAGWYSRNQPWSRKDYESLEEAEAWPSRLWPGAKDTHHCAYLLAHAWATDAEVNMPDLVQEIVGDVDSVSKVDKAWRNETVQKVAQNIYENRRFDDMPLLADALEEAGCDDPILLGHCRNGKLHYRGCWVLDLILDKS